MKTYLLHMLAFLVIYIPIALAFGTGYAFAFAMGASFAWCVDIIQSMTSMRRSTQRMEEAMERITARHKAEFPREPWDVA
jgi:hypothetical protein